MSRNKTRAPGISTDCGENDAYQVGFCKPPPDKRWHKGQSGNLRGRPKNSLNLKTIASLLAEELGELISVQGPDGKRKVSKQRAYFKKLVNDALTGGAQDKKLLLNAIVRLAASDAPAEENAADEAVLGGIDVLDRYVDRAIRRLKLEGETSEKGDAMGSS